MSGWANIGRARQNFEIRTDKHSSCIHYFLPCWDKCLANAAWERKGLFWLGAWEHSPSWRGSLGENSRWLIMLCLQSGGGGWEWVNPVNRFAFSFLCSLSARVGLSIPIDLILPIPHTHAERFVTEMVLDHVKLTSNINPYSRQTEPCGKQTLFSLEMSK